MTTMKTTTSKRKVSPKDAGFDADTAHVEPRRFWQTYEEFQEVKRKMQAKKKFAPPRIKRHKVVKTRLFP